MTRAFFSRDSDLNQLNCTLTWSSLLGCILFCMRTLMTSLCFTLLPKLICLCLARTPTQWSSTRKSISILMKLSKSLSYSRILSKWYRSPIRWKLRKDWSMQSSFFFSTKSISRSRDWSLWTTSTCNYLLPVPQETFNCVEWKRMSKWHSEWTLT